MHKYNFTSRLRTLLDDDQVEDAEVGIHNAATDRLAFALAGPAGAVAGVPLAEQQTHATVGQHTLLHGEALLVVTATDAHHVTLGIGQEGKVSYLLLDLYRLELIRVDFQVTPTTTPPKYAPLSHLHASLVLRTLV